MAVDLLFEFQPSAGPPWDLLFGETLAPDLVTGIYVDADTGGATLQATLLAELPPGPEFAFDVLLADAVLTVNGAGYINDVNRAAVGDLVDRFQQGGPRFAVDTFQHQQALPLGNAAMTRHQDAVRLHTGVEPRHQDAVRAGRTVDGRYQQALRRPAVPLWVRYQDSRRTPVSVVGRAQQARRQPSAPLTGRHQDTIRTSRASHEARHQQGRRRAAVHDDIFGQGVQVPLEYRVRFQQSMKPPIGVHVRPPIAGSEPCYIPDTDLLFDAPWLATTDLLFICERHVVVPPEPGTTVVVPIKRIYAVLNNVSLRRVDGNIPLPQTSGLTLSLDDGSWTWGFSAVLPGRALADLEPTSTGEPVEIEATINGVAYRGLIESISRDRTFARSDIRVSGRGKAALLDAPYAPTLNFGNPFDDLTAQQLATEVLTINGVPLGWSLDWKPEDWLVPSDAWSHAGTYISALNAIASAAGAYLQPHRTDESLSVLLRYPAAPWDWASVIPDFELPADPVQKESIEWIERARYNRVYVSGLKTGVIGKVTRAGTAGNLVAPMVVDQLITSAAAARQRALPVLANVGRQALLTLRLPILSETGVIPPGKFIRFIDAGVTRIGITRSVSVTASLPTIWQTIGVETHVAA